MKKALQSENKSSTKWEKSSTKWIKALQSENKSENRQVLSYLIANFSAPLFAKVGHLVPHWGTIFESVKSAPLNGALIFVCNIVSVSHHHYYSKTTKPQSNYLKTTKQLSLSVYHVTIVGVEIRNTIHYLLYVSTFTIIITVKPQNHKSNYLKTTKQLSLSAYLVIHILWELIS